MFDKLCTLQCTLMEISYALSVSEDTIERACKRHHKLSFADYYNRRRQGGFISLRRAMWQKALGDEKNHIEPSVPMQMFLAKELLGYGKTDAALPAAGVGNSDLERAVTLEQLQEALRRDWFMITKGAASQGQEAIKDVTPSLPPASVEDPFK